MDQFFNSSFTWFTGVVEDVSDPEKLNRVRVRVFGLHTEDKVGIPTEDLPWATVMMPTTTSGQSGIGESPHFLLQGSWVVGFFRDSSTAQDPIIMGTIASKQDEKRPSNKGFSDPDGTYPVEELVGESDVNRLARGEDNLQGTVQAKKDSVEKGVQTPTGSWDEPETPYAAEYPKNHVQETEAGHIFEIDDTEGAERIHEYHKAGTWREVHPDGTEVIRINKERYTVIIDNDNCYVKGNVNLTVDTDVNMYVKGDWNIKVDNNVNMEVGNNWNVSVGNNEVKEIGKDSTHSIGSNLTQSITTKHTVTSPDASVKYNAGSIEVVSGSITDTKVTLHSHTHGQGVDSAGHGQDETKSPTSGT